jgi:hypothetical protein
MIPRELVALERSTEMADRHVAPAVLQILGDKTAMAMVRLGVNAQQATIGNQVLWCGLLDSTFSHQRQRPALIRVPIATVSIRIKHCRAANPEKI